MDVFGSEVLAQHIESETEEHMCYGEGNPGVRAEALTNINKNMNTFCCWVPVKEVRHPGCEPIDINATHVSDRRPKAQISTRR